MTTRWAALAILLVGCGMPGEVFEIPGQVEATRMIWNESYGRTDAPPAVKWVTGDELDCTLNDGRRGFSVWYAAQDCMDGGTAFDDETSVAYYGPGDEKRAFSVVAHEAWHVIGIRAGHRDTKHLAPAWQLPEGIVPRTQASILAQ